VSRDWRLYLEDIERACEKIGRFTQGFDFDAFVGDERTYDAVLRNLEVIGEAAKRVPDGVRGQMPDVPWRAIAGFRDFVAHVYFAVDDQIVWNTVQEEVPKLLVIVGAFLRAMGSQDVPT
jgi:uncharacterized protein with HEPN domain